MIDEFDSPEYFDQEADLKSKTQVKNELKEITQFGMELAELSLANLKKLPLNEVLIEAFADIDRMKGNEARKRHFKRIGKLLREVDIEPLQIALDRFRKGLPLTAPKNDSAPSFAKIWSEKFLEQNENPESFMADYPHGDRQQLRQLIRNAQKSAKNRGKLESFLQQFE